MTVGTSRPHEDPRASGDEGSTRSFPTVTDSEERRGRGDSLEGLDHSEPLG